MISPPRHRLAKCRLLYGKLPDREISLRHRVPVPIIAVDRRRLRIPHPPSQRGTLLRQLIYQVCTRFWQTRAQIEDAVINDYGTVSSRTISRVLVSLELDGLIERLQSPSLPKFRRA